MAIGEFLKTQSVLALVASDFSYASDVVTAGTTTLKSFADSAAPADEGPLQARSAHSCRFPRAGLRSFLLVLLVIALDAHSAKVVDTGAYLAQNSKIFWSNDDAIIFAGYGSSRGVPQQLRPPIPKTAEVALLLEYQTTSRKLTDRGTVGAGGLCFDSGFVRYAKPVDGATGESKWQPLYGRYGQEVPQPPPPARANASHLERSWNCRFEHELAALPAWASGRQIKRLRPGHGFLEFTGGGSNWYPVRAIRANSSGDGTAIKDFEGLDTDWPPVYEPLLNTYLISGRRPAPGGIARYELWRLSVDGRAGLLLTIVRDGDSRSRLIRAGDKEARFPGPVSVILPLKNNRYVFDGGALEKGGRLGDMGLYVLDQGTIRKIAKGRVAVLAASPNGCRAAAGIDPQDPAGPDQFRVHVLDVCEE